MIDTTVWQMSSSIMIYDLFSNAEIRELGLEDLLMHRSEKLGDLDEF